MKARSHRKHWVDPKLLNPPADLQRLASLNQTGSHGFKRFLYYFPHLFRCPTKYLTDPWIIRYCRACGRVRYANRHVKQKFQPLLKGREKNKPVE